MDCPMSFDEQLDRIGGDVPEFGMCRNCGHGEEFHLNGKMELQTCHAPVSRYMEPEICDCQQFFPLEASEFHDDPGVS